MNRPGLSRLSQLEAEIARDFQRLNHPPADWVPPRMDDAGQRMADVAIIGGGMCGLAAAFAMRRLGISHIAHVDQAHPGQEGPWITYARMRTLRSPKHLTGPAQGMASLSFRAWWEAQGQDWEALDRIPRADWMRYLTWYGRLTGAQVQNEVRLDRIEPSDDGVRLSFSSPTGRRQLTARRVVLATGREGQALPRVPQVLAPYYGAQVQHSSDPLRGDAVQGRRVAVIGLGASAFDNAAEALDLGAREVTLIGRAPAIPRLNKMKQTVYPGFSHGFPDLPDAEKLRWLRYVMEQRIAPPRAAVQRLSQDARATLILGAAIDAVQEQDGALTLRLRVPLPGRTVVADHVILGTGFAIDLGALDAVGDFAGSIETWGNRVPTADGEWGQMPYLGPGFEFLPRQGTEMTDAAGLSRLPCFTHAAQLSLGNLSNDIPAVSEGANRLARAIASALFLEDRETHWTRLQDYAEPELLGNEWPGVTAWDPPLG